MYLPIKRPHLDLRPPISGSDQPSQRLIRSLPDLVDFHIEHNPHHAFCLQAEVSNAEDVGHTFVTVTYERLQQAILRCQGWILNQAQQAASGPLIHPPSSRSNAANAGDVEEYHKCAPVGILMESDAALAIYVLALMGLGVPTMLLSTRLSPLAVRHLLRETGSRVLLASRRLKPLAKAALGSQDDLGPELKVNLVQALGYETLLNNSVALSPDVGQPDGRTAHQNHYLAHEDRQVLILHSSGTSGLPKPIYCSHKHFLGFAACHDFSSIAQAQGLTISTSPFFHVSHNVIKKACASAYLCCWIQGFGMVPICLSLGIGKTMCIPPASMIPTGVSISALLKASGAKALLTVPSIIEEIALLPDNAGVEALQVLDFVAFGGGIPKSSVGDKLQAAGVKLINHYGATETGPMTAFYVPEKDADWRNIKLRTDIVGPLDVRLARVDTESNELGETYRLSMRPLGWKDRFELQDLLFQGFGTPRDEHTIAGRTDDLICLGTGEKVRPTIMESLLNQQDGVKATTVFGDGRSELIVLVESTETFIEQEEIESFRSTLWPIVEQAGRKMDAHARISSPTSILVLPPGSLPRSDKGTVLRREVAVQFAEQIERAYVSIENASLIDTALPLDLESPSISSSVRALVQSIVLWDQDWGNDQDLFVLGMDSLQATRLRRSIVASVQAKAMTNDEDDEIVRKHVPEITTEFVYRNPSVDQITEALLGNAAPSTTRQEIDANMIDWLVDAHSKYAEEKVNFSTRDQKEERRRHTVVITGATGSLGSFLVHRLVNDASVERVICLNRRKLKTPVKRDEHDEVGPVRRQKLALQSRGFPPISEDDHNWCSKVEVHETDTWAPHLGLAPEIHERLASRVTHILHAAWPMSFKMAVESFESSFKTLQNLIQLTIKSAAYGLGQKKKLTKPRILFVSSISTVGNYNRRRLERSHEIEQQDSEPSLVPEVAADSSWVLDIGYAKAKLVCEKMIARAAEDHCEIEAGLVRVGQMSGARNGYWNAEEHFVALVGSSQMLGKFPMLRGTLSWLPVDSAAAAAAEILLGNDSSHGSMRLVYHLENPVRQWWQDVVAALCKELQIDSIVPFEEWLDLVATADDVANPAKKLVDFFSAHFNQMALGELVLDTVAAQGASATLAGMRAVDSSYLQAYISYWRSLGVLK